MKTFTTVMVFCGVTSLILAAFGFIAKCYWLFFMFGWELI